jgi:predicted Zn-dependent peptidase
MSDLREKRAATKVETWTSPTLREEVHRTLLPGGLEVLFCPKPGFRKRYACYSTHYGSIDSEFRGPGEESARRVPDGIAHFLEHTLFETPRGNISELFARNGAYSNAATSFNTTTYIFAAAERFFDNLELLLSFVEAPTFDAGKVEKEKGIIEQEIQMYQDDPGWVGYMGLLESLFERHPLRLDIAGSAESIRGIDVEALGRCYRTFYSPRNMILFVIGDLDREEVFDFVAERSAGGKGPAGKGAEPGAAAIERVYPEEPEEPARLEFRREMEVALPKLLLGFKEVAAPASGRPFLHRELVSELMLDILFGRGSDCFQRLYQEQLILDDFGASFHSCSGVAYAALGGETPRPEELRKAILLEVERVQEAGIPSEDFERQKRKFMGSFIRHFNSLEYIAGNYTYFRFHQVDLFQAIDILNGIRREEVEERARALLDQKRSATSLVSPRAGSHEARAAG